MPDSSIAVMEDAAEYAERAKIFQLFESLLQDLVVHKPDKPLDHLIKVLKREPVPRVVVTGPPGAEARSLCELISAKCGLVHVIASDVWRELARLNSPDGLAAKAEKDAGKEPSPELTLKLLEEKLGMSDCVSKGWVLEGFPADAAQARKMSSVGLLPSRFLHIEMTDAECVRRLSGRRIDPESNTVYHMQDMPPPNKEVEARLVHRESDMKGAVEARLLEYRQKFVGVLPCFEKVAVALDGSTPGEAGVQKLLAAALPTITADMPSRAPRGCPRVLLIGGPGSQTETLGAALAQAYGAKHVSALELLHGAALNGSKKAAQAMSAPQPLVAGDALLGPLVSQRLALDDVRTAGFVLTGYPQSTAHAAFLKKNGIWVRHCVHLKLDPKRAMDLVTGSRYDPSDGEIYHVESNKPADESTLGRLVVHPKDDPKAFKADLKAWEASKPGLMKVFADQMLEEDATRPEGALVERLAKCFLSL